VSQQATRKVTERQELANAVRAAGRRCRSGEATDISALGVLITSWSRQRPMVGAHLQALLKTATEAAANGERENALRHLREVIEVVMCSFDPSGKGDEKPAPKAD
jgi:hypothetical protein